MSREDRYSLIAAVLCFGMAWMDANWRTIWQVLGSIMLGWTIYSIFRGRKPKR